MDETLEKIKGILHREKFGIKDVKLFFDDGGRIIKIFSQGGEKIENVLMNLSYRLSLYKTDIRVMKEEPDKGSGLPIQSIFTIRINFK